MDKQINSTVYMTQREHLELTGISEVISFEETLVAVSYTHLRAHET